ncbi:MAG: hypothetical protein WDN26_02655 [Chitinophagaceae bacterium]
MALIKSIVCLGFFLLLWIIPSFRNKCIIYFNLSEQFLIKNKKLVLFTAFGLYILIIFLLQQHHPIDGDEGQAWLIARDTDSFKKMYSLMGYEGTPGLWHTIQRPFAQSGISFNIIYFFNFFFIIAAILIWLWLAPFPLLIRILLPFSHILLTEYSVNARSYALSVCLLFAGLALFKKFYNKWLAWSILFFLLANTNIHSTLLCCGFALFLLLNGFSKKDKTAVKGAIIIGIGILLATLQVFPPADLDKELANIKFQSAPAAITISIITGTIAFSLVIYFSFLAQLLVSIKNRLLLFSLLSIQVALFFLFLFKYPGQIRHHFFLFLGMIMCIWIGNIKEKYKATTYLFLFAILCMMITTSVSFTLKKINPGNNHKKEITDYIKKEINPGSKTFIACHPDNVAVAILPNLLPYKQFYMPDANRWGSYVIWNQERKSGLFNPDIVRNVADLSKKYMGYNEYFYLTINKLPVDSANYYHITLVKQSTNQYMVNTANTWNTYYLYKLSSQ